MLIRRRKGWELPEGQATSEHVYLNRRRFLGGAGALVAVGALAGCDGEGNAIAAESDEAAKIAAADGDPSAKLYPVARNPTFTLDRPMTDEEDAITYNNYYEFGSGKSIWRKAQALPIRPWTLRVEGLVEKPFEIGIDDLLAKMPLEERLYRHRCVEAWAMAVPWSGFQLSALVDLAKPLGSAKYLRFTSFENPDVADGQRASWYPWPYIEGLTMAEATNELAFMATGLYGKPMPKQNGAPLRLALPWKYGFKSSKGLVSVAFTEERPISFWEELQGSEYGFWANVNPEVPHPRWSQAKERLLGTDETVPTQLYNGYGEFVAGLYTNLQDEPLYM
ncbi:MAG: protein-methionine-sulfoxide reductase catalytic subunit MsrP [Rhodospirillales bacterium]